MKTLEAQELKEHIDELLRLIKEEGETIEVTDHGEVIARLVPARKPKQSREQDAAAWAALKRLSEEIGAHWKGDMDAVEAVRDVRRDL